MDRDLLEKFLQLMSSKNDSDAVMGLRGAQNLCRSEKVILEDALRYAVGHLDRWRCHADKTIDHQPVKTTAAAAAVNMSGVPECRVPRPGVLEIVLVGKTAGDMYPLPGESARHAEDIAGSLKDAVVAAVINKSRFKLKLNDLKSGRGETVETVLQAEYERPGMTPVRILANNRGEVGALATVLRKAVANSMPELLAA